MDKKSRLKAFVEHLTNSHIYYNFLPPGIEVSYDLKKSLKGFEIKNIFDVGANIGQSAETFLEEFPGAEIYCFEPVSSTFKTLKRRFAGRSNISCHRLALGATSQAGYMVIAGSTNDCSYLADSTQEESAGEAVEIRTLDSFCQENGIKEIDYLKVDTEGRDLEVLKGAEQLLSKMAISAIQVEASMNCKNELHVPFEVFKSFFEARGYYLFKIYDQVQEDNSPIQRRSNPVFISSKIL